MLNCPEQAKLTTALSTNRFRVMGVFLFGFLQQICQSHCGSQ